MIKKQGFHNIGQIKPNNFKLDVDKRYFQYEGGKDFPVKDYIIETYGKMPTFFHSDDLFSDKLFDFLVENADLLSFTTNGKLNHLKKDLKGYRGGTFWFRYKTTCFLALTVKNQDGEDEHFWDEETKTYDSKKIFNLSMVVPCGFEYPLDDFVPYLCKDDGSKIHLFIKNQYGDYAFEPLKVKLPKEMNLELNYGKDFLKIYETLKSRMAETSNGLYMFHGAPGTGKSSLIKYMAGDIKRDFIYIPTSMLESFTSDPACLQMLFQKQNSVLVLEDAEKLIMKRVGDGQDSSAISSLLNLSDGILSDILNVSVLITYNCDTDQIDSALKRKGRMQMDYRFELLSFDNSKKLGKHLNYSDETLDMIVGPMSLADIYNLEKANQFCDVKEEKRMGFNQ